MMTIDNHSRVLRGCGMNASQLCPLGHQLRYEHLEAFMAYASLTMAVDLQNNLLVQEAVEGAKQIRQAAVEQFVDHLATCAECLMLLTNSGQAAD
jgi:hypothetical protein